MYRMAIVVLGLGRLVTRMANPMADPWFPLLCGVWGGPFSRVWITSDVVESRSKWDDRRAIVVDRLNAL